MYKAHGAGAQGVPTLAPSRLMCCNRMGGRSVVRVVHLSGAHRFAGRRGGAAGMIEWSTQTIGVVVSWMCYNPQDTRTDTRVWMRRLGRRGREYAGMRNSSRVYFSVGSRACRTPTGALCHSRRSPSACWEAAHAGQDG